MAGPLLFVGGVLSLIGSAIGSGINSANQELQMEERRQKGYSYGIQLDYDYLGERLTKEFDFIGVINSIREDYPNMSESNAVVIAKAAIGKRLMEEETSYKYESKNGVEFFDLDKYATDNYRKERINQWHQY